MVDVLIFGAHPDDSEFGCGGLLAKMAAEGKSIVLADLTLGEMGTNGTPDLRKKEALQAADLLNAKRIFLDFQDCHIQDTYEGRLALTKVIRTFRPKLVLAPLYRGTQNHPDHLACGQMARVACRYSRLAKILPELPPFTPQGILHYLYPGTEPPDFLIDVTPWLDSWKKLIGCHASQMLTYHFEEHVLKVAAYHGLLMQAPFAQGLIKGNPIVVDDLMVLSQGTREL